jgi:hypothetical protein
LRIACGLPPPPHSVRSQSFHLLCLLLCLLTDVELGTYTTARLLCGASALSGLRPPPLSPCPPSCAAPLGRSPLPNSLALRSLVARARPSLFILTDSDEELLPPGGDPAAAADVPGTAGRKRPSAQTRALALSPTGDSWAAATTEGLLLYALDSGMTFDPTDLTEALTPAAFHQVGLRFLRWRGMEGKANIVLCVRDRAEGRREGGWERDSSGW